MALHPGQRIGPWVVDQPLGSGGHADVVLALHHSTGQKAAVKLLRQSHHEIRERLLREGEAQRALNHKNVVAVREILEHNGQPALVMDYVDGPSLQEVLTHGPLSTDNLDRIAMGLLAGVGAAHEAGIVHRDLKPANILIESGVPRICDFGIAKLLYDDSVELSATQTGSALGTPAYMAPEQIRDARRVDFRADVYSIGAVLYECAVGHPAFPGEDLLDVFTAIAAGTYVPVVQIRHDLPPRMLEAINCALRPDPNDRYASAGVMRVAWRCADDLTEDTPAPISMSKIPIPSVTPMPVAAALTNEVPIEPAEPEPEPIVWDRFQLAAAAGAFVVAVCIAILVSVQIIQTNQDISEKPAKIQENDAASTEGGGVEVRRDVGG